MEYTIIANGKSYDLPKKTLRIAEEIEKTISIDESNAPIREKYKAVLKACQTILGQEATDEILGTYKLEDMDLSEITILFEKICASYQEPLEEFKNDRNSEMLSRLPIAELEKVSQALASIPNDRP